MNATTPTTAARYNVVTSCMTYAGAMANSVKMPRKAANDDDARRMFLGIGAALPDGAPRSAWSHTLTLVKWTDAGREVIAERSM